MINTVIFDLNGIFIKDSGPLSKRIEKDYGINADEIFPLIKTALKEVRRLGSESRESWQPVLNKLKISYDDFFKYWLGEDSLNKELLEYVKQLKSHGVKVFLLSNNFPERTNTYRRLFPELFKEFDKQYFSWETGFVKPDVKAWKNVLDENRLDPSDCLYFDDSKENVEVAMSLGFKAYKYENLDQVKNLTSSL